MRECVLFGDAGCALRHRMQIKSFSRLEQLAAHVMADQSLIGLGNDPFTTTPDQTRTYIAARLE